MKHIAVSGAGGFLGGYLLEALSSESVEISALSSKTHPMESANFFHSFGRMEFSKINWPAIDILIHCAFPRKTDPLSIAEGLQYTGELLTYAADNGVQSVIEISSQSVYDPGRKGPAKETDPVKPSSGYALGKYAEELLTDAVCRDIPHTKIRMASLIGPHFDQRVVNKMVLSALEGRNLLVSNGYQNMGFLDVRDAVSALVRMTKSDPVSWKREYNLGIKGGYSVKEIAETVAGTLRDMELADVDICFRDGSDYIQSSLDCSRFYSDFAWRPAFTLRDSVREIAGSFRQVK